MKITVLSRADGTNAIRYHYASTSPPIMQAVNRKNVIYYRIFTFYS